MNITENWAISDLVVVNMADSKHTHLDFNYSADQFIFDLPNDAAIVPQLAGEVFLLYSSWNMYNVGVLTYYSRWYSFFCVECAKIITHQSSPNVFLIHQIQDLSMSANAKLFVVL